MGRLQNCCCCDLKTGAIIIGWLGLVGGILNLISGLTMTSQINTTIDALNKQDSTLDVEILHKISRTAGSSVVGTSIVEIIINAALLWGINKENKLFLLPWLISRMITIVVVSLVTVVGSIFLMVYEMVVLGIVLLLVVLCAILFLVYCWACVISLYKNFSDQQQLGNTRPHEEIGFIDQRPMMPPIDNNPPPYKHV